MKVLLRQNIRKLGQIGDIVDVKPGYARNYLVPQGLAFEPTAANVKKVENDKAAYLEQLAKQRAELETRAKEINGKEVTITSRANEEGHLYGSVGPAQIAAALVDEKVFVHADEIHLGQPIRQLDKYEVPVVFAEDISATVTVWVVPVKGEEPVAAPEAEETPAEDAE